MLGQLPEKQSRKMNDEFCCKLVLGANDQEGVPPVEEILQSGVV
jgi:hypothetical protein